MENSFDIANTWALLFEGLSQNLLIVLLASIVPLGMGILLTFFQGKNMVVRKVFAWLSLPFECLAPVLFLVLVFYIPLGNRESAMMAMVKTLSICFLGYLPARYIENYSFLKNILYNGLSLLSALFKWSFIGRLIALTDLSYYSMYTFSRGAEIWPIVVAIITAFIILAIFEMGKRFIKQFLK